MPQIDGYPFMLTVYSDYVIVQYADNTVGTNRLKGQSDISEIREWKEDIRAVFVEWENIEEIKKHGNITHWMPYPDPAED